MLPALQKQIRRNLHRPESCYWNPSKTDELDQVAAVAPDSIVPRSMNQPEI